MAEIDEYTTTITRDMVTSRIEELEAIGGFKVIRLRTGETLFTGETRREAKAFVVSQDYLPTAVEIDEDERDDDEQAELDSLQELDSGALRDVDDWQYGTTLIRYDQFDGDYVRQETRELDLLPSDANLNSFPYSLIDWNEAVDEFLDIYYQSIDFEGTTYYYR